LTLKKFLKTLSDDGRYYAELVSNLAEIYYLNDNRPCVLVEVEKGVYHLNFRSDLVPNVVAQISSDIARIGVNHTIGPVFAISQDRGVVYGDEAMGMHYVSVFMALQPSQSKDDSMKEAIFVVQEPIETFSGKRATRSDKIYRKLWGE
jgi:hypothetical protein